MRYYPISNQIRKLANTLQEKESFDIRGLLSKIPGLKLPTKEQAVDILLKYISEKGQAAEGIIKKITDTIRQSLLTKTASRDVTAGFMDTLKGLKTLANPSVILATIALMGALNTAEAGPLLDKIKQMKSDKQQEVSEQQQVSVQQLSNIPDMITLADQGNLPPEVTSKLQGLINSGKDRGIIKDQDNAVYGFNIEYGADRMDVLNFTQFIDRKAMDMVPGSEIVRRIINETPDGRAYCISIAKGTQAVSNSSVKSAPVKYLGEENKTYATNIDRLVDSIATNDINEIANNIHLPFSIQTYGRHNIKEFESIDAEIINKSNINLESIVNGLTFKSYSGINDDIKKKMTPDAQDRISSIYSKNDLMQLLQKAFVHKIKNNPELSEALKNTDIKKLIVKSIASEIERLSVNLSAR